MRRTKSLVFKISEKPRQGFLPQGAESVGSWFSAALVWEWVEEVGQWKNLGCVCLFLKVINDLYLCISSLRVNIGKERYITPLRFTFTLKSLAGTIIKGLSWSWFLISHLHTYFPRLFQGFSSPSLRNLRSPDPLLSCGRLLFYGCPSEPLLFTMVHFLSLEGCG